MRSPGLQHQQNYLQAFKKCRMSEILRLDSRCTESEALGATSRNPRFNTALPPPGVLKLENGCISLTFQASSLRGLTHFSRHSICTARNLALLCTCCSPAWHARPTLFESGLLSAQIVVPAIIPGDTFPRRSPPIVHSQCHIASAQHSSLSNYISVDELVGSCLSPNGPRGLGLESGLHPTSHPQHQQHLQDE